MGTNGLGAEWHGRGKKVRNYWVELITVSLIFSWDLDDNKNVEEWQHYSLRLYSHTYCKGIIRSYTVLQFPEKVCYIIDSLCTNLYDFF